MRLQTTTVLLFCTLAFSSGLFPSALGQPAIQPEAEAAPASAVAAPENVYPAEIDDLNKTLAKLKKAAEELADLNMKAVEVRQELINSGALPETKKLLTSGIDWWLTSNTNLIAIVTNQTAVKVATDTSRSEFKTKLAAADQAFQNLKSGSGGLGEVLRAAEREADVHTARKRDAKIQIAEDHLRREIQESGILLDQVGNGIREYGSITMSAPLITSPGGDSLFDFDFTHGATNYFNEAKTQRDAEVAYFEQILSAISVKLAGQFDPTMAKAYAASVEKALADQKHNAVGQNLLDGAMRTNFIHEVERSMAEPDPTNRNLILSNAISSYKSYLSTNSSAYPTSANFGAPASVGSNRPEQLDFSEHATDSKLKAYSGLLTNPNQTSIPNRAALITAAGDQAVEAIFKALGDPERHAQFKDKTALFSVVTIGVNPSWRTSQDFAADITMKTQYEYQVARQETLRAFLNSPDFPLEWKWRLAEDNNADALLTGNRPGTVPTSGAVIPTWLSYTNAANEVNDVGYAAPIVYAVSPLMETSVMDQQSSTRNQSQFALALAAILKGAGYGGEIDGLLQYAQQVQTDVRGVASSAAMNAYSAAGGISGFQVGPRFRAISDASAKKKKSGYILERQTFPAIFLIGMDNADILPKLRWVEVNDNLQLRLMEPTFSFSQTARWLPLKESAYTPTSWGRMSERWMLESTFKLRKARTLIQDAGDRLTSLDPSPSTTKTVASLLEVFDRRSDTLRYLAIGNHSFQNIPLDLMIPSRQIEKKAKFPSIAAVQPREIFLPSSAANAPGSVTISVTGSNLGSVGDITADGPTTSTASLVAKSDTALVLNVSLQNPAEGFLVLKPAFDKNMTGLDADVSLFTPPVKIRFLNGNTDGPAPASVINLEYESSQPGKPAPAKVKERIELSPSVTIDQLKEFKGLRSSPPDTK